MPRETPRYAERARPAFLPALIAAVAALAGLVFLGTDSYYFVQLIVTVLALILLVIAGQSRAWLWAVPLVVIAVLWNPVVPFGFDGTLWRAAHILAAAAFLAMGLLLRVPVPHEPGRPRR